MVGAVFFGVPLSYFAYMKKRSTDRWNLNIDRSYAPSATVLVPVHNEEKLMRLKLENIAKVNYPSDKLDVVVVNDCSVDGTLKEVNQYITAHPEQKIHVFDSQVHLGKVGCLNRALENVRSDVVIISDVDCFWPSDILTKSLVYLSDSTVGAVTAREWLLNSGDSWVTVGEQFYNTHIQAVRIGESKLHSTIIFQGGFAAYKRNALTEFNHDTDDSGTALDIVQTNLRSLLIPEIGFFTVTPATLRSKINIKIRRAGHLQHLWARSLNLLVHGKLAMPKRIAIPEIILHIFNPLLMVLWAALTTAAMVAYPLLGLLLLVLVGGVLAVRRARIMAFEFVQNNLILLLALSSFITKRNFKLWKPTADSRSALDIAVLRKMNLI